MGALSVIDLNLVEKIYDSVCSSGGQQTLLQDLADAFGAAGAMVMTISPAASRWTASPRIEGFVEDFFDQGWHERGGRLDELVAEAHPGFRAEADLKSEEQIRAMPVHREFLDPAGFGAGSGTLLPGLRDVSVVLTLEGFASHDAAKAAIPALDLLRPHLSRALSLAAHIERQVTATMVDTLQLSGVAAAVIDSAGKLRVANPLFEATFFDAATVGASGNLRWRDARLQSAVDAARLSQPVLARSVPVTVAGTTMPAVAHLIPLHRHSRELAGSDGVLVALASVANVTVPDADLLRLLFDLTPAEARLARCVAAGDTLEEGATKLRIAKGTARKQIAAVFSKVGVTRQAELVRVLNCFGTRDLSPDRLPSTFAGGRERLAARDPGTPPAPQSQGRAG